MSHNGNSSKSCCCQDQSNINSEQSQLCCRPFYPMKSGRRPIKTVVYLRPNGSQPPCCPMPCPPKAIVTTFPGGRSEEAPPAQKKCLICTVKRIPVLPPPPPTPPLDSPCRPHIVPC